RIASCRRRPAYHVGGMPPTLPPYPTQSPRGRAHRLPTALSCSANTGDAMRTVLVTLDTPRQRADLELPAEAPVGDLLPLLLDAFTLAGTRSAGEAASGWLLRAPNGAALHPARSLMDGGIVDGMRLTLQDVASFQMERQRTVAAAAPPQVPASPDTGGIGIRWNRDGLLP
ncbi:MAG: EsaB/YukD family protein, partial [Ktedonobacterales bacterium]